MATTRSGTHMAYTLYGTLGSGSAAIEMALHACDAQWQYVDAASWKPRSSVEELRRVNPLVQIPTIVLPGGAVLTGDRELKQSRFEGAHASGKPVRWSAAPQQCLLHSRLKHLT